MSSQKRRKIFRNKKFIFGFLILFLLGLGYWLFFYTDYKVENLPENHGNLVLINTTKLKSQYLKDFLMNPSVWSTPSDSGEDKISLMQSGVEIPDVAAFFQFPQSGPKEWYLGLKLKNPSKWKEYLTQEKFQSTDNIWFTKDKVAIFCDEDFTLISWNAPAELKEKNQFSKLFISNTATFDSKTVLKNHNAVYFSVENEEIPSFSVDLGSRNLRVNSLEKCNSSFVAIEGANIAEFNFRRQELETLPLKNNDFLNWDFDDVKGNISSISAQQDTIVTYGYDENFDEIATVKSQVIYNPEYDIILKSNHPEQLLDSLRKNNRVNENMEFVMIPFNQNQVSVQPIGLEIKTGKAVSVTANTTEYSYFTIGELPKDENIYKNLPIDDQWLNLINNMKEIKYVQSGKDFSLEFISNPDSLPILLLIK